MNNKVNYTLVGLIVLLGIIAMLGFAYWMLKPSKTADTQKYLIFFNESVLGLNLDAPVKYKGIKVGKVVELRINPQNTEQIEVTVEIQKTTPIKEDTVAKLTAQGITGLSYINLSEGANNSQPIKLKEGQKYPVIKSAPSFFADVERSLGSVSELFVITLDRAKDVLNDENQKQFALLLNKSAKVMQKIDKVFDERTMHDLQKSIQNIQALTDKADKSIPKINMLVENSIVWEDKINDSFVNIKNMYLKMGKIMNDMASSFVSVQDNVEDVTLQTLPTLNTTMEQMQQTLIGINALIGELERSPSDILYKKEEKKRGPGEK